jgi:hypothetical protein
MREDACHLAPHKPVRDEIEWDSVTNAIADQSSALLRLEDVLVNPEPVRSGNLFVDKARRWFPDIDP